MWVWHGVEKFEGFGVETVVHAPFVGLNIKCEVFARKVTDYSIQKFVFDGFVVFLVFVDADVG